jgi:S-DNA-T family DNA segregation ATPase FtsK/SpoIIIE
MDSKSIQDETIRQNVDAVLETFAAFDMPMELSEVIDGLTALRIRLKPTTRVRMSAIREFADDLCYALAAKRVDITAPILGTTLVEVAIPKERATPFLWSEAVATNALQIATGELVVPIGRNDFNEDLVLGIATLPHLLVSGVTGSGKSTLLHGIINSLTTQLSPERLGLVLIDPKRVEFFPYEGLPHLLTPVLTNTRSAMITLKGAVKELQRRFEMLIAEEVRDIQTYHDKMRARQNSGAGEAAGEMPYIVIVVDELSDLMAAYPCDTEGALLSLAQMGDTVGIHLILSTARPASDVFSGLIKANIPARIAFRMASPRDSRTVLNAAGAEKLRGMGDMLYLANDTALPVRCQACYLSEADIEENVKSTRDRYRGVYHDGGTQHNNNVPLVSSADAESADGENDPMYEEAERIVRKAGKASTSILQRRLGIGYGRAANLIDMLENRGVVGPADGSTPRRVVKH